MPFLRSLRPAHAGFFMRGAVILTLLAAPVAHAQAPQLGAGQVMGNSTAAQRPARAENLSAMLDRAFCSTANAMLARLSGSWICLASANSSILVTNGSGVPAFSTTLPAFTLGGTVTGGGNSLTGIGGINTDFASIVGTGGAGFLSLTGQSANPGTPSANNVRVFGDATGQFSYKRGDGFARTFASTPAGDVVWTMPAVTATLLYSGGPLGSPSTAGTMPAFVLGGAVTASGSRTTGIDLSGGTFSTSTILLPNGVPLQQKDSGGTTRNLIYITGADAMIIGNANQNIFLSPLAGVVPLTDNASIFGGASNRWASVHTLADKLYGATSGVITLQATATAGTNTITLPAATGTVALTAGATIPTIAQGDLLYGSAANTLSALAKNTSATRYLANTGTTNNPAWAQVDLTNGVTGTAPVGNGGTGLATYTSGGIPYASSTSTLASSALLTANQIVLGGGAGTAPATLGSLGTTSTLLHGNAAGAPTFGSVVSADLNITPTTCSNQFVTAISAGASASCATPILAGASFANQGTTTTVLHGNAAGNPSWGAVSLTTDVTGTLPVANGGTSGTTAQAAMAALKGVYTLGSSAVQTSNTGNTTETTLATITIPANAMGANGAVRVTAVKGSSGTAGTHTLRIKFGATAYFDSGALATYVSGRHQVEIHNRNATNSQVGAALVQLNFSSNSGVVVTSAIDTTSSVNITITGQLSNVADTITLESYLVELIVP